MKALPFTHLVKGRYWYFRHSKVGHVRIVGDLASPIFMEQYRKWLRRAGHTITSARNASNKTTAAHPDCAFTVYLVQAGAGGPIKIGCAVNVTKRVKALQTGSSLPLELLCTLEGGSKEERRLHGQFKNDHLRGEWFQPSEALLNFAKMHAARI